MKCVGATSQHHPCYSLIGGLLSMGIAATTALFALPTQAITIVEVKTHVFPYVPRDYSLVDVGTGRYAGLDQTGVFTLTDLETLEGDDFFKVSSDAQLASTNAFSVSDPTAVFGTIDQSTIFTGVGSPTFTNVIDVQGGINLSGGNKFTINALQGESVVLNIRGDLKLSDAAIELTGGVKVDNVLINVLGNVWLENADVFGTILAVNNDPQSNTRLSGSKVAGTVIARDIVLENTEIGGVYFVPEPFTILGTGTALGFGVLFKKESSKKNKKEKAKV